jgi:hypothetical protein
MVEKKTFKKVDISNKKSKITIYKINNIVTDNEKILQYYKKLNGINDLKKEHSVKYIIVVKEKSDAI